MKSEYLSVLLTSTGGDGISFTVIGIIISVTMMILGIVTFVTGRIAKASNDGILIAKVEQCIKGIEDLKRDVKENQGAISAITEQYHGRMSVVEHTLKNHDRQISEIFKQLREVGGKG